MPYFGVSHLTFRKTYRFTRSSYCRMRPVLCQLIKVRCPCHGDRVALFAWVNTPTIHNDQYKWTRSSSRRCTHTVLLLQSIVVFCLSIGLSSIVSLKIPLLLY